MMEMVLPLFDDFDLKISRHPSSGLEYSTAALQKGWLLRKSGEELSEEAVGFGVPVLQRGLTSVFPSGVELDSRRVGQREEVTAVFRMNLAERIAGADRGPRPNHFLYAVKHQLADWYRRIPPLQSTLTGISSALRGIFGWRVVYEPCDYDSTIRLKYRSSEERGRILITADLSGMERQGVTQVAIMNEQGARNFSRYQDSSGLTLAGNKIDGWNEVAADTASFLDDRHSVAFTMRKMPGAKLFRGRELVGARLNWAGFGCLFPPRIQTFTFDLKIEKVS